MMMCTDTTDSKHANGEEARNARALARMLIYCAEEAGTLGHPGVGETIATAVCQLRSLESGAFAGVDLFEADLKT